MDKGALLSIIIPVYNSELYLEDCISSILNQSFTDWELILVNDGSTDRSVEICNKYKELDERILVLNQKNMGLSEARVSGYNKATGKWISFADNDDIISPFMFESLFKLAISEDIEVVGGERIDLSCNKITNFQWEAQPKANKFIFSGRESCSKLLHSSKYHIITPLWGKIYKRELLERVNIEKYRDICPNIFFEDILMTPIILNYAKEAAFTSDVIYVHREIQTSISRSNRFTSFYVEQSYSSEILLNFYRVNGYEQLYKRQLIDLYRTLLRNYYLMKKYNASYEEKIKLRSDIIKIYNRYYLEFVNNDIEKGVSYIY